MRTLIVFVSLAVPVGGWAQEMKVPKVTLPSLPAKAADAAGFAPKGWKVQKQVSGDLNGDGRADLVVCAA